MTRGCPRAIRVQTSSDSAVGDGDGLVVEKDDADADGELSGGGEARLALGDVVRGGTEALGGTSDEKHAPTEPATNAIARAALIDRRMVR